MDSIHLLVSSLEKYSDGVVLVGGDILDYSVIQGRYLLLCAVSLLSLKVFEKLPVFSFSVVTPPAMHPALCVLRL